MIEQSWSQRFPAPLVTPPSSVIAYALGGDGGVDVLRQIVWVGMGFSASESHA